MLNENPGAAAMFDLVAHVRERGAVGTMQLLAPDLIQRRDELDPEHIGPELFDMALLRLASALEGMERDLGEEIFPMYHGGQAVGAITRMTDVAAESGLRVSRLQK